MSPRHTPREVKRYDQAKFAVAVLILLLIVVLFVFGNVRGLNQPESDENEMTLSTPVPTYATDVELAARVGVARDAVTEAATDDETVGTGRGAVAENDSEAPAQAATEEPLALPSIDPGMAAAPVETGRTTIVGTAAPADEVELLLDGLSLGMVAVADDGSWSKEIQLLSPGEYDLVAQNSEGGVSDPARLTVIAPAEPPQFDSLAFSSALTTGLNSISGQGAPGSEVEVFLDGLLLGRVPVDDDGVWALDARLLSPGQYTLDVRSSDGLAGDSVAIAVDAAATSTEDVVAEATDAAAEPATEAATEPATESASVTETGETADDAVADDAVADDAVTVAPPTIDETMLDGDLPVGPLMIQGAGAPSEQVTVFIDALPLGETEANEAGQWTVDARILAPGAYELTAEGAQSGRSTPVAISVVDALVDEADAVDEVAVPASLDADQFADSVAPGPITISGQGNPGEEVEILLDDLLLGVAMADETGSWTLDAQLLAPGDYTLRAANTAGGSEPVAISVLSALAIADADATLPPTEPAAIAAAATAVEVTATVEVPAPTPDETAPVEAATAITPTVVITATVQPDAAVVVTATVPATVTMSATVAADIPTAIPTQSHPLKHPLKHPLL